MEFITLFYYKFKLKKILQSPDITLARNIGNSTVPLIQSIEIFHFNNLPIIFRHLLCSMLTLDFWLAGGLSLTYNSVIILGILYLSVVLLLLPPL
jgi:hypothetical protein